MSQAARSPHPVRKYIERVASKDIEENPEWDLTVWFVIVFITDHGVPLLLDSSLHDNDKCITAQQYAKHTIREITQKPLPKLPVPELDCTLKKYLLAIKPIVSAEQYQRTEHLVEEFGKPGGQGEMLNQKLREFADSTGNWAYNYWLDDMYLKNTLPLPINSNVSTTFPQQVFADQGEQLRFAARLISGILDYKVIVDSRSCPIDRARHSEKGQPFCMEQYYRLFSSYRVPGIKKDALLQADRKPGVMQEPEHIIVIAKNQYFVLDVVLNFSRLSDDNIYTQLKRIQAMAEEGASQTPNVGILTANDRDVWARARLKLMEDAQNRASLEQIETCIFVLCLDDATPAEITNQNDELQMSQAMQFLHGHGTHVNSCNRWYDKTMQFIVSSDGAVGLNYEHSPAEGVCVSRLTEHLFKYMEEIRARKLPRLQTIVDIPYPRKLVFNTDTVTDVINDSIVKMDKLVNSLDFYILKFTDFGKNFPKRQNTSPDAFIQLALQLTYYKVHHHLVSTYESASIRRFRLGRVDNIRACTIETLEWCKAVTGETKTTAEEQVALFRKAIKKQTEVLLQAILGYGIDNHLLGLRETAANLGLVKPDIFKDESYQISNHFTLSTSQVPTTTDLFMCYGPVVPDGYGVCYNPKEDFILFCICSFVPCGETKSDYFADVLQSSLRQMKEMLLAGQPSEGSKVNGSHAGSKYLQPSTGAGEAK